LRVGIISPRLGLGSPVVGGMISSAVGVAKLGKKKLPPGVVR
jgi:hypothetical protein